MDQQNFEFEYGTILSHNGYVTIKNPATGQHRTFEIHTQSRDAKFAPGQRIVGLVKDGERNTQSFAFVDNRQIRVWRRLRGGVFDTYADMLLNPRKWEAKGVEYMFEGRCRVCNRTLTNPESIGAGIGPVCAQKVSYHW